MFYVYIGICNLRVSVFWSATKK